MTSFFSFGTLSHTYVHTHAIQAHIQQTQDQSTVVYVDREMPGRLEEQVRRSHG